MTSVFNFRRYTYLILLGIGLLTFSCELNINNDDDCIKCYYDYNGGEVSQEHCDPLITEEFKRAFRIDMQMEADSLMVKLTCKEF